VLRRMFLPGTRTGMSIGTYGEDESPIPDRDLDRDARRMSSPPRCMETKGGVSGRYYIGDLTSLVRRRDLQVPL